MPNLRSVALILARIDLEKPFTIEVDASDFDLGNTLSQPNRDGQCHPIMFNARKFNVVEIKYEVHDKGLLAIIESFEQ